ncbi:MAG: hypothetical protein N2645_15320 [Clostridia bacterium]|nr:hypothetical protein [Clostridia bacterium]
MTVLICIAFIGIISGSFIIFKISPMEFTDNLIKHVQRQDNSIKARITAATKKKKVKGIKLIIKEAKEILEATNKSSKFLTLCIGSFAMFIAGVFISIMISNLFLIPVLAIGMGLLPFWYILFTAAFYKKQLNSELETALSVITASYLRTESIIIAVDENITYLNPPVADVFRGFLTQTRLINSNIGLALERLKDKIDNNVFREWCDALIACQEDKTLKSTLLPIVSRLSDVRIVTSELEYLLYEPMKEFITMAILLIGNIPLLYFLNRSWFNTLLFHPMGKLVLAITGVVMFISLAAVIRLTKPIDYKR